MIPPRGVPASGWRVTVEGKEKRMMRFQPGRVTRIPPASGIQREVGG